MTLALPSDICLSGKLKANPWPCILPVAPSNDVEKAPLLTVGQAQVAVFAGIGSVLAILLATYTSVQVMSTQFAEFRGRDAKEKEEISQKIERLEQRHEQTNERLIKLEIKR